MGKAKELLIRISSIGPLKLKMVRYGLIVESTTAMGDTSGSITISHLDTGRHVGLSPGQLEIDFEDPNPWVSVYETDGRDIRIGLGTPVSEGLKATLVLTPDMAEELIDDIKTQLSKIQIIRNRGG